MLSESLNSGMAIWLLAEKLGIQLNILSCQKVREVKRTCVGVRKYGNWRDSQRLIEKWQMEGNGSVAARCMECEQNVVSVRQRQIWEVTGKYGKGQEFKYFIAPGKVSKNMLPRNCCIKGLFVNA